MSFQCQVCGNTAQEGTRQSKRVVATREATYPYRREANSLRVERSKVKRDDPGGVGIETEREINVCAKCKEAPLTSP